MKKDGQRRVDKLMRLHYDNRAVVKLVADTVLLIICCLYLARLRIEKSGVIPFSLFPPPSSKPGSFPAPKTLNARAQRKTNRSETSKAESCRTY